MTRIIGIDPGLKGGIVELTDGEVTNRMPMPINNDGGIAFGVVSTFLRERCPFRVYIEQQQPMRREGRVQGVASTFKTGRNFGNLEGICLGALLPCTIVHAKTWQKTMMFQDIDDTKARSIATAKMRWPDVDWKRTSRCKYAHDGMTDAANIACYGWQCYQKDVAP